MTTQKTPEQMRIEALRVLFTTQKPQATTSGLGHIHPLVPLARAAQATSDTRRHSDETRNT